MVWIANSQKFRQFSQYYGIQQQFHLSHITPLSSSIEFFENVPGNNYLIHYHTIPINFIPNYEIGEREYQHIFKTNIYLPNINQEYRNQTIINKSNFKSF